MPIFGAAASTMAATALASLGGVFEDAFRRAQKAVDSDLLPAATTIALYTQAMCLRHLDKADDANQLLRRAYSRDAQFSPAREALDDQTIRLTLTSPPEAIQSRTNVGPDSAPSKEAAEAAKHSAQASKLLAEGDAELKAMLGMEPLKGGK